MWSAGRRRSWWSRATGAPASRTSRCDSRPGPEARRQGSRARISRAAADAVESGVAVGEVHFPGAPGLFADGALRAALFAVPPDAAAGAAPTVVAADQAGNRRTVHLDAVVRPRRFAEKTLELSDDF